MTNEDFEGHYYPKYNTVIRAIARKLAQTNDTLAEDLYQEGLIALWKCDPRRSKDNEDAYIRQAVKFRMIDMLRREKLATTESLDARLEGVEQLMADEAGQMYLLSPQPRRFYLPIDYFDETNMREDEGGR